MADGSKFLQFSIAVPLLVFFCVFILLLFTYTIKIIHMKNIVEANIDLHQTSDLVGLVFCNFNLQLRYPVFELIL